MTRVPYRKITHFINFIWLALVIGECILSCDSEDSEPEDDPSMDDDEK